MYSADLKTYLENWQYTLDISQKIRKAIQAYNGKCLNKRFADALNSIDPLIYTRVGKKWANDYKISLEINIKHSKLNYNEYCCVAWVYNIEEITEKGTKKLKADLLLEDFDKRINDLRQKVIDTQVGLSRLDEYKAEIQKLKDYAAYINNMIPDTIKTYCGLRVEVKTYKY